MTIELKKLKHYTALSDETNAFSAELYVDGVKIAECRNDGRGGNTSISAFPGMSRTIDLAEKWCDKLPGIPAEFGDKKDIPMDLELYVDEIVGKDLEAKEIKRGIAQLERNAKKMWILISKKTLEDFKSGVSPELKYRTFGGATPAFVMEKQGKEKFESVKQHIAKMAKGDEFVYVAQ